MMEVDSATARQNNSDWNYFMKKLEAAEVEFINGRPEDFKSLWSHTDDATLSGGLGGAIEVGWENVAARLDWVSPNYAEGTRSRQEFSCHVYDDFAYLVQKEFFEARVGSDTERSKDELRVTMVFRRESNGWRIVHRHADSQTAVSEPQ